MEKRIYNSNIKEKVMIAYPVTRKEKRCAIERSKREYLRAEMAKRLYDEAGQQVILVNEDWNKREIKMTPEQYRQTYFEKK